MENVNKICVYCNENKPLNMYSIRSKQPLIYRHGCKKCTSKNRTTQPRYGKWQKENIKRYRTINRFAKVKFEYNLSKYEYDNLLLKHNGFCGICNKPETAKDPRLGKIKELSVDHDHNTNKVRGLLCQKCNMGLGAYNDNVSILESAINYLKKHQSC